MLAMSDLASVIIWALVCLCITSSVAIIAWCDRSDKTAKAARRAEARMEQVESAQDAVERRLESLRDEIRRSNDSWARQGRHDR